MREFITIEIAEDFYSIEQDFVRSFLVIGEREALLVDTGVGGQDLKRYVENITKLPIRVIFTHADGDHVGGAEQFERRFMHPSEFDYYRNRNTKPISMKPVWEGDILNLGNYCFEVILIPGHTPGSIALLERKKRFLIGGDSIQRGNIYMFGKGRNFEAFRASMKKLEGMLGEFDLVYASHHELTVKADTVRQLYHAAGKVMEGKVVGTPVDLGFGETVYSYETDGVAFYAF
jgi:hydroxyacylglutathione hydrolase